MALREGEHGVEPDVIATTGDGTEIAVEVGRVMDAETFARELRASGAQERLLVEFCHAYRSQRREPPSVHVGVEFSGSADTTGRKRVVDAVMEFVDTGARPNEWAPIAPLPAGVSRLEIKFSPVGSKAFFVPSAGAFSPRLHALIEQKSAKAYAEKGDVIILAVVPTIQPWMRGPWLDDVVERVQDERGNSPAPFRETVGLDETTGEILFAIP